VRHDEYRKIRIEGREAADFAANTVNMATAYGLALQGIGLAPIDVNLAPVKALRDQMWGAKTKWFAASAAVAVIASGLMFVTPVLDDAKLESADAKQTDQQVTTVVAQGKRFQSEYKELETQANLGFRAENLRRLMDDRRVWPALVDDATSAIASTGPQIELLGESADLMSKIPPAERRNVNLDNLGGAYTFANGGRRIKVEMLVTFTNSGRQDFLNDTLVKHLRDLEGQSRDGVPYTIVKGSVSLNADRLMTVTVGEDGLIKMPEMPNTPTGNNGRPGGDAPASESAPTQEGTGSGLGDGSNLPGKRQPGSGNQRTKPGSGLGFGNNAGEGSNGSNDPSQPSFNNNAGNEINRNRNGAAGTEPAKFDLESLAPVPTVPTLLKKGDTLYRGVVTFEVELAPVQAGAGATQEQPQQ
jgi:hypothetical protein